MHIRCPHCQNAIEYLAEQHEADFTCPSCDSRIDLTGDETLSIAPAKGEVVAHFELLELLGTGGFGSVYSAKDTKLDRLVAVKLPRYDGMQEEYLKKFFKEARAAAQVKHPNIVAIHEIGQDGKDGRVYIVSDLVEGVSLSERLKHSQLSPKRCAELSRTILEALHTAHEAGVVHRDLKPGNILLNRQDEPFIADFGLAKRNQAEMTVTARGAVLGTPAYMSPEQASGDGWKADARSDIYSVGVMLYRMLTGKKPFIARESRMLLQQVLNDDPAPLRKHNKDVPKDLQTICLKAMEKDPAKRYQTAAEMAEELNRYLEGYPIHARPMSAIGRAWRWARRNRLLAAAGSVIAVLSVALVVAYFLIPTELKHPVNFNTQPEGAELAIAPLDPKTREPIADEVIFPGGTTPLQVDLPPGDYLIVARKGTAFHEVTRRVPIDPAESSRWRQSQAVLQPDGSVTVPEIYLFEQPLFDDTTVLVDGGTFIMGKDAGNGTPPHERTVPSFYMMEDEVTVEMFATVARLVEKLKDQDLPPGTPMGSVSWGLATDVAEKLGGRLPTEAEFEYAATNAGTTEFPWGNDPSVITEWKFGPVRIADYDVRPGEKPIYGLYSNYAEWTSTPMHSYPGSGPIPEEIRSLWSEARIVRSGDAKVAEGKPGETNFANFARRYRVALDQGERHPQLGFRCVRSAKPRFLP